MATFREKVAEMEAKGMKAGKTPCSQCACQYANEGGSSTHDNGVANAKGCKESVIRIGEVVVKPQK